MHRNLLKGKSFFLDSVGKILIVNIHLGEAKLSNSTHTEDIVSENFPVTRILVALPRSWKNMETHGRLTNINLWAKKKQIANFVEPNGTEYSAKTFLETRHSISKDGNLKLGYNLIN